MFVYNPGIIINFWWTSSFFLNQSFHEVLLISYPNQSKIQKPKSKTNFSGNKELQCYSLMGHFCSYYLNDESLTAVTKFHNVYVVENCPLSTSTRTAYPTS